jgi:hypothetical protein
MAVPSEGHPESRLTQQAKAGAVDQARGPIADKYISWVVGKECIPLNEKQERLIRGFIADNACSLDELKEATRKLENDSSETGSWLAQQLYISLEANCEATLEVRKQHELQKRIEEQLLQQGIREAEERCRRQAEEEALMEDTL